MKYILACLLISCLAVSGCSFRSASGVLEDIAQGVIIFQELRGDWAEFNRIAEEEGVSSDAAIAAGQALWDSAVKLRPITYKQLKKHPELIEKYSLARITLASVLEKDTPPELTLADVDAFLANN